jgi:hypothetical protein
MSAQQSHIPASRPRQQKPPFAVFLASVVVIFFSSLSAADSVGFVPYYIDGTAPAHADHIALADLPTLGEPVVMEQVPVIAGAVQPVLPERLQIDAIGLDLPNSYMTTLQKLN